jgi:heterodisulfide reductase subunit C2
MAIKIKREVTGRGIIDQVIEISGIDINSCLQCKKCTNGCPVSGFTSSSPSEIIKRLQLGAGEELLDSEIIWTCVSCATCFSRCPMEINMADVMDALRVLAAARGAATPEGNMPLMNKILLGTIKTFGRTYDLGAMALYKAGTSSYGKDLDKLPMILGKGKIALFPPSGADKKTVKRIFNNLEKTRKKSK